MSTSCGPSSHPSISAAKLLARRRASLLLRTLSRGQLQNRSALISDHLRLSEAFHAARTILLFAPMETGGVPEVDLTMLASHCLAAGTPVVCLPRLDWSARTLTPAVVTDWSHDLVTMRHGVREPAPACPTVSPDQIDLVLVPALAFDRYGHRLGRGGGFYDRFLSTPGLRALCVGVAFDRQLVEPCVPTLPHDACVHQLVTESGIQSINNSRAHASVLNEADTLASSTRRP